MGETKQVPVPPMQSAAVQQRFPHMSRLCDVIKSKEALYVNRKVGVRPRWIKLFDVTDERRRLELEAEIIFILIAELERKLRVRDVEYGRLHDKLVASRQALADVGFDVAALQNKYNSMTFWQRLKWAFTHK